MRSHPSFDRQADDRRDSPALAFPDMAARYRYGVGTAIGSLTNADVRQGVNTALTPERQAALAGGLREMARGWGMQDRHFADVPGLKAVSDTELAGLRRAARGVETARTVSEMGAAGTELGQTLARIGRDRLPRVVADIQRGVAALRERNERLLAGILEAEAGSDQHHVAMPFMGQTLMNRMKANGTMAVEDVAGGYSTKKVLPQSVSQRVANQLLDNVDGVPLTQATHYYSPGTMPKEGGPIKDGADIGGGLETVPGMSSRTYQPGWPRGFDRIPVPGVADKIAKFYRQKTPGHVR